MGDMSPREQLETLSLYGSEDGEPKWFKETIEIVDSGINPIPEGVGEEDFSTAMSMVGASDEDIQRAWDLVDRNDDGVLDTEEVDRLWTELKRNMMSYVPSYDTCDGLDCLAQS